MSYVFQRVLDLEAKGSPLVTRCTDDYSREIVTYQTTDGQWIDFWANSSDWYDAGEITCIGTIGDKFHRCTDTLKLDKSCPAPEGETWDNFACYDNDNDFHRAFVNRLARDIA